MSDTRHKSGVVLRARQLVDMNMSIPLVQRALEREFGCRPAIGTIRTWTDDEYLARRREQWSRAQRDQRRGSAQREVMDRMRALREECLSYRAIAAVLRLDTGINLTEEQVRYAFKHGRLSKPAGRQVAA